MASCSSRSARDRELHSGSRTVDIDTYQAHTVCILARDVCKGLFRVMGCRKPGTQVPIPRRQRRNSGSKADAGEPPLYFRFIVERSHWWITADFCPAVRPPYGALSRRSDTEQISWGKLSRLPWTGAGSTLRILDGYGLRGKWPARPTLAPCTRCLSIDPHVCYTLPSDLASRRYLVRS